MRDRFGASERRACKLLSQPRATQRYLPIERDDEKPLTCRIIELASMYGRYGYRANIVTYTIALIAHKTAHRVDLDRIWREQVLTASLTAFIEHLCHVVHKHITTPSGGQNVTEWCKKPGCWHTLRDLDVTLPNVLSKELIPVSKAKSSEIDTGMETVSVEEKKQIGEIAGIPADTWFAISKWAKETKNLQSWQRSLAYSLGRLAGQGREPSRKQAAQGKIILDKASELGFVADSKVEKAE